MGSIWIVTTTERRISLNINARSANTLLNFDIMKINEKLRKQIIAKVRNTEEYKILEDKKNKLYLSFRFAEANKVIKMMKEVEERCINKYIKHYAYETKKVSELIDVMTEEDRDRMNTYGNMLIMVCDIVETANIEMNQLLKKYHPTFRIESFDKVAELSNEASGIVKMLDRYSEDEYYTNTYGTVVDNLFEMCFNKAKSFIGKIKKNEERANKKATKNAKVA